MLYEKYSLHMKNNDPKFSKELLEIPNYKLTSSTFDAPHFNGFLKNEFCDNLPTNIQMSHLNTQKFK